MRMMADCRLVPSEKGCSLVISGEPEEVIPLAVVHAVVDHSHEDTPELHEQIEKMLIPEGLYSITPG